jgi:hypothetical protein
VLIERAAFVIVAVNGGELLTRSPHGNAILVDLSTPHAIAPEIGAVTIDQLPPPDGALVERGVSDATLLIEDELAALARWIATRQEPRWTTLLTPVPGAA